MKMILAMVRKELVDAARDKRSVMAGLYYAIGTPLIMCAMFMVLIGQLSSPEDLNINIHNADKAPDLVRYLSNNGINHGEDEQAKKMWHSFFYGRFWYWLLIPKLSASNPYR